MASVVAARRVRRATAASGEEGRREAGRKRAGNSVWVMAILLEPTGGGETARQKALAAGAAKAAWAA
jgi:hypothetical protein